MNDLIYGKNPLTRVVAIEIKDNTATIFRELETGEIEIIEKPHKYWILSNRPHSDKWVRLKGQQHYKWGKQYDKLKDWLNDKNNLRKRNCDIYCVNNTTEAFQIKDGYTLFKDMTHDKISVLSFDIETTGLYHNKDSKIITISNTFRNCLGEITRKLFCYDEYENCAELIDAWAEWVRGINPTLLVFHNGYTFDLPYLDYCYKKTKTKEVDYVDEDGTTYYKEVGIPLGRNGEPMTFNKYESKFRIDGTRDLHYKKANIYGRQIVDTMFLAYKYDIGRKYESYGLKKIIEFEGLEKKDRQFYDAGTIRDNYTNPKEWEKIKAYAIDDADDSLSLWDLMGPVMFYLCPVVPKPLQLIIESASGSQINSVMVRGYLQEMHSVAKASEAEKYEGAISFGIPGVYNNVQKIDFAQLYPSIMMQYEIYDADKDPNKYFNTLVKYFADYRQKYKRLYKETGEKQYDYLQNVAKVIANSCYGFLGASGLNYNSPKNAAKITSIGRDALEYTIEWATSKQTQYWIDLFKEKTE